MKLENKVKIYQASNFYYTIGLLATDGCVYSDLKRISFTSKDYEQVINVSKCLGIKSKIGENISGNKKSLTYRIQMVDKDLVEYLLSIGIGPNKSKTISRIKIPKKYFFDFLRGCFDGDGSIYSYYDKRWKSSFMFYLSFASASPNFISWIRKEIKEKLDIIGHVTTAKGANTIQLKYAKNDSIKIIYKMYYAENVMCLTRKKFKVYRILDIVKHSKHGW